MAEKASRLQEAGVEDFDEEDKATAATSSCGCFGGLRCGRSGALHRYETTSCQEEHEAAGKDDHQINRLVKEVKKKVKVLPEILFGPKWKTLFIPRLRACLVGGDEKGRMRFLYDPKSYALNFDDGIEEDCDGAFVDFSARYACPLGINKVDLGLEAH